VGSGGGIGIMSGRDVCWRKMLLSWSNWWRWLLVIEDNGEEGGGDNSAWDKS
jgi:hypothetical protein